MPTMTDPLRLASDAAAHPGPSGPGRDEPRSFEVFFEAEKAGLYSALCLVTRDRHEAEELTQDAFVRVLAAWDRAEIEDPTAYLYRTAMNAFRSRRRRAAVAVRRAVGAAHHDDAYERIESMDAAVRALAPLSRQQRAAVVLIDLLGFSSEQAARMLGVRPSTVRMHASRAHATLRTTMGGAI
jgi:RNA polymerase sigma factor (sigma-70 family)